MDFDKSIFDEVMRDLGSRIRDSEKMHEQLQNITVEAKTEDDLIRLTVGPPGYLRKLELDPRVKRLDVETIAEKITTLMNDASSVLEEEISAKIQSLMPDFQAAELLEEFTRINRPPGTR